MEMIKYEQAYFEGKGYDKYGNYPANMQRTHKLINITQPKSVLDVGCAFGYIVYYLNKMGVP